MRPATIVGTYAELPIVLVKRDDPAFSFEQDEGVFSVIFALGRPWGFVDLARDVAWAKGAYGKVDASLLHFAGHDAERAHDLADTLCWVAVMRDGDDYRTLTSWSVEGDLRLEIADSSCDGLEPTQIVVLAYGDDAYIDRVCEAIAAFLVDDEDEDEEPEEDG